VTGPHLETASGRTRRQLLTVVCAMPCLPQLCKKVDARMFHLVLPDVVSICCRWRGRHCIPAPDEHACHACALSHPTWPGRPNYPPLPPSVLAALSCATLQHRHRQNGHVVQPCLALEQPHAYGHRAGALRAIPATALTSAAACVLAGMSMALHADQCLPGHRSRVSRASTTASTRGRCAGLSIFVFVSAFVSTSSLCHS